MTIDLEGKLNRTVDAISHVSSIFPDDTSKTCTLTAHLNAHT